MKFYTKVHLYFCLFYTILLEMPLWLFYSLNNKDSHITAYFRYDLCYQLPNHNPIYKSKKQTLSCEPNFITVSDTRTVLSTYKLTWKYGF